MGMNRSERRFRRSVGTRDHDESTRDERWKGGYDDSEAKHHSKGKSSSSQREDKDHKSRDRGRSKISDVSKKREKESKDVNDPEKDKTWDDDKTLKNKTNVEGGRGVSHQSASELQDRIMRMKEERLKKKSDDASNVVSWVSKIRKLEEMNAEKEKALQLSKTFEEQDNVTREEDKDEPPANRHTSPDLAGFKVLDGLDKVVKGGAVVLTLKDQNILADGDINQDVDMLENVEIGEQTRRNEAYKAAKKNTGAYDTFIKESGFEKKMLPQYDDSIVNEVTIFLMIQIFNDILCFLDYCAFFQGETLDERGNISAEAEKTLKELRRRIDDASVTPHFEDLTSTEKSQLTITPMKRFLRLDSGDHGSRSDGKRQVQKEEHERSVAEKRNNEEEEFAFGADEDDLGKSLQRAIKLALKMKDGTPSRPHAIALFATSNSKNTYAENGDSQENRVVFTETEEFVWSLQRDEGPGREVWWRRGGNDT
ncbi:SART-1 family protein DOT2 [Tanacetum coccineum]